MKRFILPLVVLSTIVLLPSSAAPPRDTPRDAPPKDDRAWPGGIGVARLTAVSGDVTWKHAGSGDVMSAEAGVPLVGGDSIRTNASSKAEIRLDRSNFVRLNADSEVQLLQLGDHAYRLSVVRGDVAYTMMKRGDADVEMKVPGGNVIPRKSGVYRIVAKSPETSAVTVRKGEAEVMTSSGNIRLKSGKTLTLDSSTASARSKSGAPAKDSFDAWVTRRDKILDQDRGPVYAGWYPGPVTVGLGWGWGWPYWGWGSYWGPAWRPAVGVAVPIRPHAGRRR